MHRLGISCCAQLRDSDNLTTLFNDLILDPYPRSGLLHLYRSMMEQPSFSLCRPVTDHRSDFYVGPFLDSLRFDDLYEDPLWSVSSPLLYTGSPPS